MWSVHCGSTTPLLDPEEASVAGAPQSNWTPISRMRTHELVLAEIEDRLIAGSLKAGDRLPAERHLAEALGVSRGAVREALRILEAIGVVEAGTGSGPTSGSTIVTDSTTGMAMVLRIHLQLASFSHHDLVEVRCQLERLSASEAATAATNGADMAELESLIKQMSGTHTTSSYHDLDAAFHVGVARMSGNALTAALMGSMREALQRAMVSAFERLEDPASTMRSLTEEHAAIVEAIAEGNGERAADLMDRHIKGFYSGVGF